jgi:hypothetical protein
MGPYNESLRSITGEVGADPAPGLQGRLATSRSGRDAGTRYLVIGMEGPTMVLVADGRGRPIAHAKRKNLKHLEFGAVVPVLADKLAAGRPITDEEIRAAIPVVGAQE